MPNMGFRGIYAGANSAIGGRIISGDLIPAIRGNFYPTYAIGFTPSDTNFNYTTLLLKAVGSNTQQNYTFLDSSTNNFTVTRNGDVTQGSFSPYGLDDGSWSVYFDGSGDYLSNASAAAANFGTGDFTFECWVYFTDMASASYYQIFAASNSTGGFQIYKNTGSSNLVWDINSTSTDLIATNIVANRWYHIAVTRSGSTVRTFLDGALTYTYTNSFNFTITGAYIGAFPTGASYFPGYISNLRIVKGTAVYTSAFTPSTTGLTAISGTSLLTCQSNRFRDSSTNNFTVTRNGDTKISAMTPFNQNAPYTTTTYGGSAFFDGTGDYLSCAANTAFAFGTGDFTVEAWIMRTGGSGNQPIMQSDAIGSSTNDKWWFAVASGGLFFGTHASGGFNVVTTTTFNVNEWYHVAVTRSSGTMRMFVNGANTAFTTTGTPSGYSLSQNGLVIGGMSTPSYWTGYISDARVIKGTALYTNSFTIPTAPLTAVANTSLLFNASNAGIVDASRKFNLYTDGDVKVATNIFKYDKSFAYDGTGDIVKVLSPPEELNLTTATFTLEAWVYVSSLAAIRGIAGCATTAIVNNASIDWGFRINTNGTVSFLTCSSTAILQVTSTATVPLNTWVHVAVVREDATANVYVNGVGVSGTVHATTNSNRGVFTVGSISDINPMLGYIEDLRLTKNFKRYTANFTPPTASLPTR